MAIGNHKETDMERRLEEVFDWCIEHDEFLSTPWVDKTIAVVLFPLRPWMLSFMFSRWLFTGLDFNHEESW